MHEGLTTGETILIAIAILTLVVAAVPAFFELRRAWLRRQPSLSVRGNSRGATPTIPMAVYAHDRVDGLVRNDGHITVFLARAAIVRSQSPQGGPLWDGGEWNPTDFGSYRLLPGAEQAFTLPIPEGLRVRREDADRDQRYWWERRSELAPP